MNAHNTPLSKLNMLTFPWPFSQWGIDILGPFYLSPGELKLLIVAVYYCTKWIEALAKITTTNIQKLFERNISARYEIHQSLINDNRIQFTNKNLKKLLEYLKFKHHFTSVEHPQTNGKAEVVNQVR